MLIQTKRARRNCVALVDRTAHNKILKTNRTACEISRFLMRRTGSVVREMGRLMGRRASHRLAPTGWKGRCKMGITRIATSHAKVEWLYERGKANESHIF